MADSDTLLSNSSPDSRMVRRRELVQDIDRVDSMNTTDIILEQERDRHNTYESKKSVSMQFRTTDIILYYFGIINVIFQTRVEGSDYHWTEITVLTLVVLGLIVQITIGILMFLLLKTSREKIGRKCTATAINDTALFLSSISTLLNGLINVIYTGTATADVVVLANATQ